MSGKNIPLIPFLKPNSNNIDPNNPRVLKWVVNHWLIYPKEF
jgi:hypothetical protein